MPANLTPQYKEAEEKYRSAQTPQEKLKALREMLALIPKHKGTDKMQAEIKRRISRVQEEVETRGKGAARKPAGQHVRREGAGQVLLLGPANAGKSALVKALTRAEPEVAPYPFTTRVLQPAMMPWNNVQVQLVDAPAWWGEGGESWMINNIRYADALLVVVDVCGADPAHELRGILAKLEEQKVVACGELPGFGESDEEEDALFDSRTLYKRGLAAAAKTDLPEGAFWLEALREALGDPPPLPLMPVSAETGSGVEALRDALFGLLRVIRVYTRAPGRSEDRTSPFILPAGSTVLDLAGHIHKDLARDLKTARVWGSARFDGLSVEKTHVLADEDVVELR